MRNIISGLEKSIKEENWYSALFILVTIPDMCAKAEYPNNNKVGVRYRNWITSNFYQVNQIYENHLCSDDFYALRCSVLHEGNTNIEGQSAHKRVKHIGLLGDGTHLLTFGSINVGSELDGKRLLYMSVKQLAIDMIKAYNYWYDKVKEKDSVIDSFKNEVSITDQKRIGNNAISIK